MRLGVLHSHVQVLFSFHRAVRLGPFVKTHTSAVLVLFSHPCSFVFASWHVSLALAIQNPPPLPSLLLEPFDKAHRGLEQPVQGPWVWASAWAWHSHHLQGQTVASACTHTHTRIAASHQIESKSIALGLVCKRNCHSPPFASWWLPWGSMVAGRWWSCSGSRSNH